MQLTTQEATLLRDICADALSELRSEIAHTDLKEFRDSLKAREDFLKALLPRLVAATH
jgi:hypothetical protein